MKMMYDFHEFVDVKK